ncbi:unnamed protein product, partial [Amoebophrya sp. A120]|eukprot:GSA120T00003723001.1
MVATARLLSAKSKRPRGWHAGGAVLVSWSRTARNTAKGLCAVLVSAATLCCFTSAQGEPSLTPASSAHQCLTAHIEDCEQQLIGIHHAFKDFGFGTQYFSTWASETLLEYLAKEVVDRFGHEIERTCDFLLSVASTPPLVKIARKEKRKKGREETDNEETADFDVADEEEAQGRGTGDDEKFISTFIEAPKTIVEERKREVNDTGKPRTLSDFGMSNPIHAAVDPSHGPRLYDLSEANLPETVEMRKKADRHAHFSPIWNVELIDIFKEQTDVGTNTLRYDPRFDRKERHQKMLLAPSTGSGNNSPATPIVT